MIIFVTYCPEISVFIPKLYYFILLRMTIVIFPINPVMVMKSDILSTLWKHNIHLFLADSCDIVMVKNTITSLYN